MSDRDFYAEIREIAEEWAEDCGSLSEVYAGMSEIADNLEVED